MTPQYDVAINDILCSIRNWRMWGRLGWQENKRRYRRTLFGPFWTTLSLGIFIGILGVIWAKLWNQDPKIFFPYLCSGMVGWVLLSAIITESCATFVSAENLIKQLQFHYVLLACSVVWRNFVVFFHNLVIFIFVLIYAEVQFTWESLWIFPGLLLFFINGIWVSVLLGLLCSRFRDIQQVVVSILTVSVFVTPIFWSAEQLGERGGIVVNLNIFYHFLNLIRAPLLGKAPEILNLEVVIASGLVGWMITLFFYGRFRRRIPYWL